MSADLHYPSQQEIEAYIRRGQHERSEYLAEMVDRFIAMLRPRRESAVKTPSTPVAANDGSHGHRLAA
jgi:hypothetical protein